MRPLTTLEPPALDGLDPTLIDRLTEGFLELIRLDEGMGEHFPAPTSPEGITPHARSKAFRVPHEVTSADAVRKVPILVQMRKRKQIDGIEERAGLMFAADMAAAYRVSGLLSSIYANASRPRGMNLLPPSERMTPDEARSFHYTRFTEACRSVGHMATLEALVYLVCEYAATSAAEVGRSFIDYKQQQQAQAVGMTLVKVGLQKLARFYGLTT